MARKPEHTDQEKIAIGNRLDEVRRLKGYSQAELIRQVDEFGDSTLNASNLSSIISGKRPLPRPYVEIFSEILNIDKGYLLGYDDFEAENYKEYIDMVKDAHALEASRRQYSKYDYLLNPFGYSILSFTDLEDGTGEYGVYHNGSFAQIPRFEMELFESEVQHYIKTIIDSLMLRYGRILIGDSSAYVFYRSMGKNVRVRTGLSSDNEYIIIINASLSEDQQRKALERELEKIRNGTVKIDDKVRVLEKQAHVKKV